MIVQLNHIYIVKLVCSEMYIFFQNTSSYLCLANYHFLSGFWLLYYHCEVQNANIGPLNLTNKDIWVKYWYIWWSFISLTPKETVECFKLFVYCLNKQLSAGDIECVEWVLKHAIIIKFKWKFFKILQHQTKTIGVSLNLFCVKKEWSVDDRWWSGSTLMIMLLFISWYILD